jgi:hypothetical protein
MFVGVGLAALIATVGTACTTHAGAAAQVGGTTIETSTMRDIVDRGFAAFEAVPDDLVTRQIEWVELQPFVLTSLVRHELLAAEAERLGVTVSGQDIDAYYQATAIFRFRGVEEFHTSAAAEGIATEDLPLIVENWALESAVTDKLFPDLVARDDLARTAYEAIVQRDKEIPLSFEEARPYLVRFLVADQRTAAMSPVLAEAADREGIAINPRFGVWDRDNLAVVFADGSVATTPAPEPSFDVTAMS